MANDPALYKSKNRSQNGETGSVKSCARVVEIFEFFREATAPVRGIDIARALGIPTSSTNELLKTLVDAGYVAFNHRTKRYGPSFRLASLGIKLSQTFFAGSRLYDLIQAIHEATHETVALTVQNGFHMQFVDFVFGSYFNPGLHAHGAKIRMVGSSAGGALLTLMSREEVIEIAKYATRLETPKQRMSSVQRIIGDVQSTKQRGFSVSDETMHPPGIISIAMPLPVRPMNAPMIVGLGGPRTKGNERQFAAQLRHAVQRYIA
jgi:DNA-binding IclR family transcriptional regulator